MRDHSALKLPRDHGIVISRYLSLAKLLDLLSSSEFFFSKVSKLADRFEGSLTVPEFENRKDQIRSTFQRGPRPVEEAMQQFTRLLRENTYVNCWTLGGDESEAMWRLYCGGDEGVCIRTTLGQLKELIADDRVYASEVRYLDFNRDSFPDSNPVLGPFTCKRLAFQHEREFRLLISNIPIDFLDGPSELPDVLLENSEVGIRVSVDPNTLIDSILTSPFAPEWYPRVVKEAVERYSRDLPVESSSLAGQPLY